MSVPLNSWFPAWPKVGDSLQTQGFIVSMHDVLTNSPNYRGYRGFYSNESKGGRCIVHVYGGTHRQEDWQYNRRRFEEAYPETTRHVLCFLFAVSEPSVSYIVLREPSITLRNVMERVPIPINRNQILEIALQIIMGVGAFHNHDIELGDLRPESIEMYSVSMKAVEYFDFERMTHLNRLVLESTKLRVLYTGTCRLKSICDVSVVSYRAPEVVLGLRWSNKADSFSVGCIVYELMKQRRLLKPYSHMEYHVPQMLLQYHQFGPVTANYLSTLPPMPAEIEVIEEGDRSILDVKTRGVIPADLVEHMKESVLEEQFDHDRLTLNFLESLLKLDEDERLDIVDAGASSIFQPPQFESD